MANAWKLELKQPEVMLRVTSPSTQQTTQTQQLSRPRWNYYQAVAKLPMEDKETQLTRYIQGSKDAYKGARITSALTRQEIQAWCKFRLNHTLTTEEYHEQQAIKMRENHMSWSATKHLLWGLLFMAVFIGWTVPFTIAGILGLLVPPVGLFLLTWGVMPLIIMMQWKYGESTEV